MAVGPRLSTIGLLALAVVACDLFETPAAFRLDPSDTTWALVKIDGGETGPGGEAVMNIVDHVAGRTSWSRTTMSRLLQRQVTKA